MAATDCRAKFAPSRGYRSPALLLASALALATALVLLAVGNTLTESGLVVPPTSPTLAADATADTRALAVRFYAALEAALVTGDTAGLAAVVAPAFVDHTARPAAGHVQDPTATPGLGEHGEARAVVAAQQTARPDLQLTPVAVLADGDRVVVYLAVDVARGRAEASWRCCASRTAMSPSGGGSTAAQRPGRRPSPRRSPWNAHSVEPDPVGESRPCVASSCP